MTTDRLSQIKRIQDIIARSTCDTEKEELGMLLDLARVVDRICAKVPTDYAERALVNGFAAINRERRAAILAGVYK